MPGVERAFKLNVLHEEEVKYRTEVMQAMNELSLVIKKQIHVLGDCDVSGCVTRKKHDRLTSNL